MSDLNVGAAQSFVEGEYGGPTVEIDTEVSLTTTPKRVVENDPECLALTLMNLGSDTVYIMFDDKVTSTRCIILQASGGFISLDVRSDQTMPTREWWAMAANTTSDIIAIRTRRYTNNVSDVGVAQIHTLSPQPATASAT